MRVKWYGSTLCITTHNMVVSAYEFAGLLHMSSQVANLTTKSR